MPTYNFRNNKTGEEYSEFMFISELDTYLAENPDVVTVPAAPPIISGLSSLKPDKEFREFLSGINKGLEKQGRKKINDYGG